MSKNLYVRFENFVKKILDDKDLFTNFKNHDDFRYMLEHVSFEEGQKYFDIIISKFNLSHTDIFSFCAMNDMLGNPIKYEYPCGSVSPTSLRYILHALLILEYMHNLELNEVNIVELGGGYGGLCLAIHHFSHGLKKKYTIIDLNFVGKLQYKYLQTYGIDVNVVQPYGESLQENDYFLISNYCFAEIHRTHQKRYISLLFPKVKYGFITWNEFTDPYDFGFDCNIIDEFPQTGVKNKYIYFKPR